VLASKSRESMLRSARAPLGTNGGVLTHADPKALFDVLLESSADPQ
jgi:hypothetical protein